MTRRAETIVEQEVTVWNPYTFDARICGLKFTGRAFLPDVDSFKFDVGMREVFANFHKSNPRFSFEQIEQSAVILWRRV